MLSDGCKIGSREGRAIIAWADAQCLKVGFYHEVNELLEGDGGLPAELLVGFGRIADEEFDFGGAEVAFVEGDVVLPVEVDVAEGDL